MQANEKPYMLNVYQVVHAGKSAFDKHLKAHAEEKTCLLYMSERICNKMYIECSYKCAY